MKGESLFWYSENRTVVRNAFKRYLDSCQYEGLDKSRYHYYILVNETNSIAKYTVAELDMFYTDALISYCIDISEGYFKNKQVSYNGLAKDNTDSEWHFLLRKLITVNSEQDLHSTLNNLKCVTTVQILLKNELAQQLIEKDTVKIKQLAIALNTFRWISHFKFKRYIVVNIATTKLDLYQEDSIILSMNTVVGKSSTPTPRFAAYCNEIIFYPYWNVPKSIAVNEILPAVKKNKHVLDALRLQVIDYSGNVISPNSINWTRLSKTNFPYRFRQSTGCDNALGIMKFNLISPYSVYMHDTNLKSAFNAGQRFFSHGCIRIEKPVELANMLLPGKVDVNFLQSCWKIQTPVTEKIDNPIPVFVIYLTADSKSGNIYYYPDVYKLNN